MPTEAKKLRVKYPDKVPVICVGSMEGNSSREVKLLVPASMSEKEFVEVIFEKTHWARTSSLFAGGAPLRGAVSEVDEQHRAGDGFLYITDGAEGCQSSRSPARGARTRSVGNAAASADKAVESISAEAKKLRSKYPDCVPVVCAGSSEQELAGKKKKLLVPIETTGKQLKKIVLDATKWDCTSTLHVGGGILQDHVRTLELYENHMAADGLLYVSRSKEAPDLDIGDRACGVRSSSFTVYHMPEHDPDDLIGLSLELLENDGGQMSAKLTKMLKKCPDRVPVIFQPTSKPNAPTAPKKMLAPCKMLFTELKKVVRKMEPKPDDDNIDLLVAGVALGVDAPMAELYEEFKAEDGLLYVAYGVLPFIGNGYEITSSIGNVQDQLRTPSESMDGADDAARMAAPSVAEDLAALQARLNVVKAELQDARDAAQKVPALQRALLDKEAELEQMKVVSKKEVADLSSRLKALTTALDDARAGENEEAANAQQTAMAEIARLRARIQADVIDSEEMENMLKQKVADGLADLKVVTAESAARLEEINDLKAQLRRLEQASVSSANHVVDLQSMMSSMSSELDSSRHAVDAVPALQQQLVEKETELDHLRVASSREVEDLKARLDATSADLTSAKAQVAEFQEMESVWKQKVFDAEARLKEVTAQQESTQEDSWVVVAEN